MITISGDSDSRFYTKINYIGPFVASTQVFHLGSGCFRPDKAFKILSMTELRACATIGKFLTVII